MGEQAVSERMSCYTRRDLLNSYFFKDIERALCHFLGHNLVPMVDESWPKDLAMKKAYEVNKNRYLSGCEENFIYARVSVEGSQKDEEAIIERGLKSVVEKWIERYGNHIRKKHGFMPYFIVEPNENSFKSSEEKDKTVTLTICMAAYIQ